MVSRNGVAAAVVAGLGVLALAQYWLADRRPAAAEDRVADEIVVTSAEDRGEGSLREAIFAADTVRGRVRIVVRAPVIRLKSPLPPLVNPDGISLEAGSQGVQLDLALVTSAPAIEVLGANSQIVGIAMVNAPGAAIRVAAPDFRLAAARITGCADGVRVNAGAARVSIVNTHFEDNGVAIRLEAVEPGMAVRENRFSGNRDAAIWAVLAGATPEPTAGVAITGNQFDSDRLSIVAGNAPVRIERNEFTRIRESAIVMLGSGIVVRGNQVRDGVGSGIVAHGAPRSLIEGNELSGNRSLAMLVRGSGGSTVRANRIYGNGYGMAFVLGDGADPVMVSDNAVLSQRYDGIIVIGDSPVIRGNRTLHNGQAGVRVLDLSSRNAATILATPYLEANTMAGNLMNDVVRGDYRLDAKPAS